MRYVFTATLTDGNTKRLDIQSVYGWEIGSVCVMGYACEYAKEVGGVAVKIEQIHGARIINRATVSSSDFDNKIKLCDDLIAKNRERFKQQ